MLTLLKKYKPLFKPQLRTLDWYPSDRSCHNCDPKRNKPKRVPPLMVRKAEWRR